MLRNVRTQYLYQLEDDRAGDLEEFFNQTETMLKVSNLIDRFDGVLSGSLDWISQFQNASLDDSFRYM